MVRSWFLKHKWVNEAGILIIAGVFAYFVYALRQAAILMNHDGVLAYPGGFIAGVAAGLIGSVVLGILIDIVWSIKTILTNIKGSEQ